MSNPGVTDQSNVAVFDGDGSEIFLNAGPLRALIRDGSKLMKHPLETGATVADHRVKEPVSIELSLILDRTNYVDTFQEIQTAYDNLTQLTVQTRVKSYANLYILEMPHDESGEIVDTVAVSVKLEEGVFFSPQYSQLPPSKVAKSSNASKAKTGQQQSSPANQSQTSAAYSLIFGSGK